MAKPITIKITGDSSGLSKALGTAEGKLSKFGSAAGKTLKAFAATAAATTVVAGGMAVQAINSASDLDESLSKVQQVFGDQAAAIEDWSKQSADAFGQSQTQALEAAGTYGNLFQAFGLGRDEASEMSTSLVELAADLASFNNTSVDDALLALQSGISGETEPLKRYGVAISDVRLKAKALEMGLLEGAASTAEIEAATIKVEKAHIAASVALKEHGEESHQYREAANKQALAEEKLQKTLDKVPATLDVATKSQAAYALIMQDTTLAQGDFERTSDGLANSQRILSARFEDLKAKIGRGLLPIAQSLVQWATNSLMPMLERWGQALQPVFKKMGEELPVIMAKVRSVLTSVVEWVVANWPKFTAAFETASAIVQDVISAIVTAIEWFMGVFKSASDDTEGEASRISEIFSQLQVLVTEAWEAILATIERVTAIAKGIWERWGEEITAIAKWFTTYILDQISNLLDVITGIFRLIKAVMTGDWDAAWQAIKDTGAAAWETLKTFLEGVVTAAGEIFGRLKDKILGAVKDAWNGAIDWLRQQYLRFLDAGKSIGNAMVDGLKGAISGMVGIGADLANGIIGAFKSVWNSAANSINQSIPNSIGLPGLPDINLPDNPIPTLATGGMTSRAGIVRVGERGPEDVYLPNGSRVVPNHASGGNGAPITVNVQTQADPYEIGREIAWTLKTAGA